MADDLTAPSGTLAGPPGSPPLTPSTTTYSPQTNVTRTAPSPGFLQGIRQGQMALQREKEGAQAETDAKVNVARQQAALYAGQADADQAYLHRRQELIDEHQKRLQAAHQTLQERFERASQDPTNYWDDKSAEDKTWARIGIWMSAVGAGITGKDNMALSYLNDQIKQDTARKQARAERLMKLAEQSRGALADAYRAKAEDLADVDAQHAAGLSVLANQAELYAKTMLPQELQTQGIQKGAQLDAAAAQRLQEAHAQLNAKIESQGAHTTTVEGLAKGMGRLPSSNDVSEAATAEVMAQKADRLEELTQQGFAPTPDEVADIANRERSFVASAHKEGESIWGNFAGRVMRGAEAIPDSVLPKNLPEETKEWWRLQTELAHAQAVKFYGGMSWMTNPETYQHAMSPRAPQMGDQEEAIADKARSVINQARTVNRMQRDVSKTWQVENVVQNARDKQAPPKAAPPMTDLQRWRKAKEILASPGADAGMRAQAQRDYEEIKAKHIGKR